MSASLTQHVHAELDRLTGNAPVVGIGYSGGGDSHALLLIARDWARQAGRTLIAFIVDHALRAESAEEAEQAQRAAEHIGVAAHILRWEGAKPATGLQAAAREARHSLLAQQAAARDIDYLLLAHTRDDQSETVWMRLAAGSSWRGCVGMRETAPSPVWPQGRGLTLVRPLLQTSRAELRTYLDHQDTSWIEDPSNLDRRYTRVRTRQALTGLSEAGFDPRRLADWALQLAKVDRAEALSAARLAMRAVKFTGWGGARLQVDAYKTATGRQRQRCLEAVVAAVSGRAQTSTHGIDHLDAALLDGERATAQGVMIEHWRGSGWVLRDPGDMLGRVDRKVEGVRRDGDVLDGRFKVDLPSDVKAEPLGQDYSGLDGTVLQRVPGCARQCLMAFRRDGNILALAGLVRHERLECEPLLVQRFMHRTFAGPAPAWFDADLIVER